MSRRSGMSQTRFRTGLHRSESPDTRDAPRDRRVRQLSHPAPVVRNHMVISWGLYKGMYDDREHRCLHCYEHLSGLTTVNCQCRTLPIVSSPLKYCITATEIKQRSLEYARARQRDSFSLNLPGCNYSVEHLNRKFRKIVMNRFSSSDDTIKENKQLDSSAVPDKIMGFIAEDDEPYLGHASFYKDTGLLR